ncbi:MAG: hypothetical protein P4L67_04815 [Candidatus Pacebacteria bacterium]|nr:hypothetical protein [Candidatus Paceibacterota bacterium]
MNFMNAHVLGSAVINIGANTQGLDHALAQTKRQMSGFLTIANKLGGNFGGAVGSIYGALLHRGGGGLGAVANLTPRPQNANPAAGAAIPGGTAAIAIAAVVGSLELLTTSLKAAAESASELQEAEAKSQQVFGSHKGIVGNQADELAAKYGVSKRETHELSSSSGLLLQGAGASEKDSAKMGANLSKLAAEASSFFNVPVEDAMRKIQSGLSGMSRPLREFGVLLTEAKVKAKAFEMGLVGTDGVVTDSAKVLARYALITGGLARAEGDIVRSQDRYSMQLRMLKGNWENLSAAIGETVLPVFTKLLQMLNAVVSATTSMVQGLSSGSSFLGRFWDAVSGKSQLELAQRDADAMNADIEVDKRNKALIQDQLTLSAEEAALKKGGGHRGAAYTDIQGLSRQIQDAITGGKHNELRNQTEIAKKSLEQQQRMTVAIEKMAKQPQLGAVPF